MPCEDLQTLSDLRDSFEELSLDFKIQKKTSGWIVEQKREDLLYKLF